MNKFKYFTLTTTLPSERCRRHCQIVSLSVPMITFWPEKAVCKIWSWRFSLHVVVRICTFYYQHVFQQYLLKIQAQITTKWFETWNHSTLPTIVKSFLHLRVSFSIAIIFLAFVPGLRNGHLGCYIVTFWTQRFCTSRVDWDKNWVLQLLGFAF